MKTVSGEQKALKKEQAYIRKQLGVDSADSASEEYDEDEEEAEEVTKNAKAGVTSKDAGYISEEDKPERKSVSFVVDLEPAVDTVEELDSKNLPLDLQKILAGIDEGLPDDYSVPIDKPEWLDMKKFKIGQEFARKYYFGLNYSEMLALMILFSFPDALQPLIFTENSGTPYTAFKRYLSTVLRVKSWFEHDVWTQGNPGYGNLKAVRAMHLNISKRLNSSQFADIKDRLTLQGRDSGVWCPLKDKIQEDFRSACPFQAVRPIDYERTGKVFVNQTDMSITQFGFVGLMLLYPERFGAAGASDEELEGFAHLWRGLGYLLGIHDAYNFCAGSLAEVRQRSLWLIERWAKPSLQHASQDWEHMSRCLVEGISWYVPGVSFEVSLFYLCWVLGVPAPRLYAAMSWAQVFMFNLMKFTFHVTLRIPLMLPLHNRLIRSAIARASSLPPEQLKKLENKTYEYESKGNFNTRL